VSAHTAGPWHTSPTHNGAAFDIGADNGANVALVKGPEGNGADEYRANARLIAAAPDLLALVLQYRDDLRYPLSDDSRVRRFAAINAAIIKAVQP
jgi:hypothetical protein